VYDSLAVERARRAILRSGWLEDLRVHPSAVAPDSLLVVVLARRAPSTRIEPLVSWLPDERIVVGGTLRVWGNAGRGERFKLRLAGVGQELVQVEWLEPRPILRLPLSVRVYADVVEEFSEAEDGIEFGRVVLGAWLGFGLWRTQLEIAGSAWQVDASDPEGLVSDGARDELRRGSLGLLWGRPPERFGWSYAHASLRVGATTGAAESQHVTAGLQVGIRLAGHCTLAAGLLYHDARGTVPRYLRHHLGGGPSLRGHAYGIANGDAAGWGGLELRVPINFRDERSFRRTPLPFEVHVFADAGSAWRASARGAESEAPERARARLRWSTGAGVGFFVRSLPLRADLGRGDGGIWRAQFATSLPF
jgi:hypothetical protein